VTATTTAWLARLEAVPGAEDEVEKLLRDRGTHVEVDDGCWWALRFGSGEHAVFTTVAADAADPGIASSLLDGDVTLDEVEVLAAKVLPHRQASTALLLRLPVRSGSAAEATELLEAATKVVERELETVAWFALRFRDGDLGVACAFPDRHARRAHLNGRFARDAGRKLFTMLDSFPSVEPADVVEQRRPARAR